jgi:hypothetical protein
MFHLCLVPCMVQRGSGRASFRPCSWTDQGSSVKVIAHIVFTFSGYYLQGFSQSDTLLVALLLLFLCYLLPILFILLSKLLNKQLNMWRVVCTGTVQIPALRYRNWIGSGFRWLIVLGSRKAKLNASSGGWSMECLYGNPIRWHFEKHFEL